MPRQRAKERACETAIKDTLAYRAFFKYPMSFNQIATYLLANQEFEYRFFKKTIRRLLKNGTLRIKDEKYYLPSIKPLSWDLRLKRSRRILRRNKKVLKVLESIPWIKLVGVTGSVAAYNAEKNADIDVFIVTTKNRLWLTRGFVAVLLKITKSYHEHGKDDGKVCPNIMVDEEGMPWPKEKQNAYTAHEIILMQPVVNKNDMYLKFLRSNRWALEYFPHFKVNFPKRFRKVKREESSFVDLMEKLAMFMQLNYMKAKKTTEITTPHLIHFNKKDSTEEILSEFKKNRKKIA